MELLLIEDEPLALERLEEGVRAYDPSVRVVGPRRGGGAG
jgi:hypothetical protein